jgi:hypothetical protein
MIDYLVEHIITFPQACDEIPRRRRGRKTHVSTLHRWATAGCKGVVLETIQIGGTRCTSREALQRFFERLSERRLLRADVGTASPPPVSTPQPRTESRRRRESETAARRLIEMGA